MKSSGILVMIFAKKPHVTEIVRSYNLIENDKLEVNMYMTTKKTPLTKHLEVIYENLWISKCN